MSDAPRGAAPGPEKAAAERSGDAGSTPQRAAPVRRLTDADAHGGAGIPRSRPFAENLAIVVGAFVLGTLVAEVAGAANLGTALSFGQIAFAIALVWVLVRR
jgi:hypothetical protein